MWLFFFFFTVGPGISEEIKVYLFNNKKAEGLIIGYFIISWLTASVIKSCQKTSAET